MSALQRERLSRDPSSLLPQRDGLESDEEAHSLRPDRMEPVSSGFDDPKPDDLGGALADDHTLAFGPPAIDDSAIFDDVPLTDPNNSPGDMEPPLDGAFRFDDEDVDNLSSYSVLDWNSAPFDYDVVPEAFQGRVVPSEPGASDGTYFFRIVTRRLARQVVNGIGSTAQVLRNQVIHVYNGGMTGVEQATDMARDAAREADFHGAAMAYKVVRLHHVISGTLHRAWPGVMRALDEQGWRGMVSDAVAGAVALMPPLERQMALARDRQR